MVYLLLALMGLWYLLGLFIWAKPINITSHPVPDSELFGEFSILMMHVASKSNSACHPTLACPCGESEPMSQQPDFGFATSETQLAVVCFRRWGLGTRWSTRAIVLNVLIMLFPGVTLVRFLCQNGTFFFWRRRGTPNFVLVAEMHDFAIYLPSVKLKASTVLVFF